MSEWVPRAIQSPSALLRLPALLACTCDCWPGFRAHKGASLGNLLSRMQGRWGQMNTRSRNGSLKTPLNKYPWPVHLPHSPYTLNPMDLFSPHHPPPPISSFLFCFSFFKEKASSDLAEKDNPPKWAICILMTSVILRQPAGPGRTRGE